MSVGRRLMLSLTTLMACTVLLGAAAVVGLLSLSSHYRSAEEQYGQLRSLYEIGFRAASVRLLLNSATVDQDAIRQHLLIASQTADNLNAELRAAAYSTHDPAIERVRISILARLHDVSESVGPTSGPGLAGDVNGWLSEITSLAASTQSRILENRRQATLEFRTTLEWMIGLLAATILIAAAVGTMQYRSVMGPLRSLDKAVSQISSIHLGHRIRERGDREFKRLIRQFNRMSGAIEELHTSMQHQVEIKSRQLIRSEQLASVGCLAAGLAHEINNPLAIIAGYAQTTLRRLDRAHSAPEQEEALAKAQDTLRIVCEEAFRCRDIAVQLLQMSQPIDRDPELISLDALVSRAIELARRLPIAGDRRIVLHRNSLDQDLLSEGHPSQLLQVFLNLITNGLEACRSGDGRVVLSLERQRDLVVIACTDNGCGMDAETLAHAFDPFFTDKPRRGLTGCGLGLSVSHAITQRHGGRLYAHSDGPGQGSTFTVELPTAAARPAPIRKQEYSDVGIA